jgi:hypothetical protein
VKLLCNDSPRTFHVIRKAASAAKVCRSKD